MTFLVSVNCRWLCPTFMIPYTLFTSKLLFNVATCWFVACSKSMQMNFFPLFLIVYPLRQKSLDSRLWQNIVCILCLISAKGSLNTFNKLITLTNICFDGSFLVTSPTLVQLLLLHNGYLPQGSGTGRGKMPSPQEERWEFFSCNFFLTLYTLYTHTLIWNMS